MTKGFFFYRCIPADAIEQVFQLYNKSQFSAAFQAKNPQLLRGFNRILQAHLLNRQMNLGIGVLGFLRMLHVDI